MNAPPKSYVPRGIAVWLTGLALLAATGCASRRLSGAAQPRGTTSHVDVDARASVQVGRARGHIQIPRGGRPGTTSPKRPRVSELGARTAYRPTFDVQASWKRHQVHVGAAWLTLHGDHRLTEDLWTQGEFYPAGTDLSSTTSLLEAWGGYRYLFDLPVAPGDRLTLAPGLGVYSLGLHYLVDGSNGEDADRSFTAYSPMLEVELEYDPRGPLRLVTEMRGVWDDALDRNSPTNAFEANLRIHGDFWHWGGLFAEVGYYRGTHHDEQQVRNDYSVEFSPYFGLGGQFRF